MGNIHGFAHRLTALSMACLASAAFTFCCLSGFGCSFIEIQSFSGRSIGNSSSGEVFDNLHVAHFGVQCTSGTDDIFRTNNSSSSSNDRLWDMSRSFFYVSLVLGGITTIVAWCLGLYIRPTNCRWRVLSTLAACSAVFQIPIFLIFESNNCNYDITRQSCTFSTGAYINIVSISIWIVMTIWVQLLQPPRWYEEYDAWRINTSNRSTGDDDHRLEGEEQGVMIVLTPTKGNSSNNSNETMFGNETEETEFERISPTGTQQKQRQQSSVESKIGTKKNNFDDGRLYNSDDDNDKDDIESQQRQQHEKRSDHIIHTPRAVVDNSISNPKTKLAKSPVCSMPKENNYRTANVEESLLCGDEAIAGIKTSIQGMKGKNVILNMLGGMNRTRSKLTTNVSRSVVNSKSKTTDNKFFEHNVNNNDASNNIINSGGKSNSSTAGVTTVKSLIKDIPRIEVDDSNKTIDNNFSKHNVNNNDTSNDNIDSGDKSNSSTAAVAAIQSLIKDIPRIEVSDDSNAAVRNDAGERSDLSTSTNRSAPGFKISCVLDDGTRHEARFPSISSACCLGMPRNSNEEGESTTKFRTIFCNDDNRITFQEVDDNDGTNDVDFLVKQLRKEETLAASRKVKRNMAPVTSLEFEKSSNLRAAERNNGIIINNNSNNSDCNNSDDISEMTRGSGLMSGVSEVLDDYRLTTYFS